MIPWLLHPCPGQPVTQLFGENPDWYPSTHGHNGIDWGGNENVVIRAAYDGMIADASDGGMQGYGLHVYQTLPDGGRLIYGHLSALNVITWQGVKAGDPLGMMGNTGRSTGVHLHFEYRPGGEFSPAVDPMGLIVERIPNEKPLCLATCTNGGVRVRTGRNTTRGIVREVALDQVERVYDFYPGGWMRLSDGYSLIGDEVSKWWEFNPIGAEPTEKPQQTHIAKGQGRFIAE